MNPRNQKEREPEVLEREVSPTLQTQHGGTIDIQVYTAQRYPRSVDIFMKEAQRLATLTAEVAESCVYAVPRDGEIIEGPSARLAEIVAHAWKNLRIQAGVTDEDDRFVTSRGEAWDVESNVAIAFEVKRRITKRNGNKYSDDMVMTTGNAAASIALRNAVFKTVPSAFWRPIYNACRAVIAGDARTFESRRDNMLKHFAVMGVTEQRLCAAIEVQGKADIKLDHMVKLTGIFNALKEGETTIEDAFPEGGGLGAVKPGQRASATSAAQPAATNGTGAGTAEAQPASAAAAQPEQAAASQKADQTSAAPQQAEASAPHAAPAANVDKPAETERPKNIGVITDVLPRGEAVLIKLDTGFQCGTRDVDMIAAAQANHLNKRRVELLTRPSAKAGFAPILEGIEVVAA